MPAGCFSNLKKRKLYQCSIASALGFGEPCSSVVKINKNYKHADDNGKTIVVDLFCGIGGFSEGARQAGQNVELAVDSDMELLLLHKKNHPKCQHVKMVLGKETEDRLVQLINKSVPPNRKWHLHASPPCTSISTCRNMTKSRDAAGGADLVAWFLQLVVKLSPDSWTMEEVGCPQVNAALLVAKQLHPELVDFAPKVQMCDFGVPQMRQRCIAANPHIINRLMHRQDLRSAAPVLKIAVKPPDGAAMVKGAFGKCVDTSLNVQLMDGSVYNPGKSDSAFRSVDKICYTCLAGNPHYWTDAEYVTIRTFTPREQAKLQTFPEDYKLGSIALSVRGVGNAVPPLFAMKLMSCTD